MRFFVVPVGSAGDVHPFVSIALELKARGHDVTVVTNAYFAPLLEQVGLPSVPVGTVEQFDDITLNPRLWHRLHGLDVLATGIGLRISPLYRLIEQEAARGNLVVVAHPLAFGARVAHETLEIPLVTVHLAPASFWSLHETPVLARGLGSINAFPRPLKRVLLAVSDRLADRVIAPPVNRFRREIGLPPVRHIISRWWHSPQRVIGLFPNWFAAPQPDWPPQTTLTGFPLYDERGATGVPPDLDAFLEEAQAAGDPPVVFAPGSGNRQARRFFTAACDACRRLGTARRFANPLHRAPPPPAARGSKAARTTRRSVRFCLVPPRSYTTAA